MLACCERAGLRCAPVYTISMMALGLALCLNTLATIDMLWRLGLLNDPYENGGALHPQHYLYALLCIALVANTVLARHKFSADRASLRLANFRAGTSAIVAPAFLLASMTVFLITLIMP
jgi:hypothetical protein